jgi:hypothetical protein
MSRYHLHLDHVVVVVPSLKVAIEQYRALGFTLTLGGNNGPTHNALIAFQDGSYIELISMRSRLLRFILKVFYQTKLITLFKPFTSHLRFRFMCWIGGPDGIRDWCIKQIRLEPLANALNGKKVSMSRIEKFTRSKPNLEIAEWLLVAPKEQLLPFFIEDISHIDVRIPSGNSARHSNGCKGISSLLLDQSKYSSIQSQLAILSQQVVDACDDSDHVEIKFVSKQTDQIFLELVGIGATKVVLAMPSKEMPRLLINPQAV